MTREFSKEISGCGLIGMMNEKRKPVGGAKITVNGNAQDIVGNTMNGGRIVIHGSAGDVIGYGMRGGQIHIRDDVGYRVGIHMKSYKKTCR